MVVKNICIGRVIKFKGLGWQKIIWGGRVAKCKINLWDEEAKHFFGLGWKTFVQRWGGRIYFRGLGASKMFGGSVTKNSGWQKKFWAANYFLQAMYDDESQK